MHRPCRIFGCTSLPNATSIVPHTFTICDFLAPTLKARPDLASRSLLKDHASHQWKDADAVESIFYKALFRATECHSRRRPITQGGSVFRASHRSQQESRQEASKLGWREQRRSISCSGRRHTAPDVEGPE